MAEKYIIDGAFGVTKDDVNRGYKKANQDEVETESWFEEYQEEQDYRGIGFGRDTGNAR